VQFHFTPTRASWLNQVEIWFSILEGKSLHAASFTSVRQLREPIDAFIEGYNNNARPFVCLASPPGCRPWSTGCRSPCGKGPVKRNFRDAYGLG